MALITCPDCATPVSDLAPACPTCGRPMAKAEVPEREVLDLSPSMIRQHPLLFGLCVVLIAAAGIGLVLLAGWWLSCRAENLRVTDRRSIHRRGLLAKTTSEVRHADVRNIVVTQSFLQRLLGVGTIGISSAAEEGFEILIGGIADPEKVRDTIDRLRP